MVKIAKLYQSPAFGFLAIACLMVGFLISKTVSNVGFLFAGLFVIARAESAAKWIRHPWLITFGLLSAWVILADMYWNGWGFLQGRGLMKAVLYLLPVFVMSFAPDQKWINRIHYLIIGCMIWSSLFSLWLYISSLDQVNLMYKTAKVIRTLAYKDHIRIGWMTVVSMLLAGYTFLHEDNRKVRIALGIYILFQFVFLHILGSKMGLITLYLSIFILITIMTVRHNARWLWLFPLIIIIPYIAYKSIPSLTERVNYTIYDFNHYIKGEYKTGLSDATRINSIKAGIDIIRQNPWKGTGFIGLDKATDEWYNKNLPELAPSDRFIPISEVLVYWAGGGIIGLLIVLSHILLPFLYLKLRTSVWFLTYFIPISLSLWVETHFENQLPLSMYGLMTGWFFYLAVRSQARSNL
jgi:hypothetical protein